VIRSKYSCDICGAPADSAEKAAACAATHADIASARVIRIVVSPGERIPTEVFLQFSDDKEDFAQYVISNRGPHCYAGLKKPLALEVGGDPTAAVAAEESNSVG